VDTLENAKASPAVPKVNEESTSEMQTQGGKDSDSTTPTDLATAVEGNVNMAVERIESPATESQEGSAKRKARRKLLDDDSDSEDDEAEMKAPKQDTTMEAEVTESQTEVQVPASKEAASVDEGISSNAVEVGNKSGAERQDATGTEPGESQKEHSKDAEAGGADVETEPVKKPRTSEDSEKTREDMKLAMALDEGSQEEKSRSAAFEAGGSTASRAATVAGASEESFPETELQETQIVAASKDLEIQKPQSLSKDASSETEGKKPAWMTRAFENPT
jgi:hypothetical protein